MQRSDFHFPEIVAQNFRFLEEFGLVETERLPTIVRYVGDSVWVNVYFGRQSYEIGFEIGYNDEGFSLPELIRLLDPASADEYRNFTATSPTAVATGVERLSGLVKRVGPQALRGDPQVFEALRRQRHQWSKNYASDVLASQLRPRAEAAFRERKYRDAVELYERMAPQLTPAEQKKLALARKRC